MSIAYRLLLSFACVAIQLINSANASGIQSSKQLAPTQVASIDNYRITSNPRTSKVEPTDPAKLPVVQWALFRTQVFTLLALIITVWKTWEKTVATQKAANATAATVEEMRLSRECASAPHIVVYLASPSSNIAEIIIENYGEGTAKDIIINIDPPLQSSLSNDIGLFFETPKAAS